MASSTSWAAGGGFPRARSRSPLRGFIGVLLSWIVFKNTVRERTLLNRQPLTHCQWGSPAAN